MSVQNLVEAAKGLCAMERNADSYDKLDDKEKWAELRAAISAVGNMDLPACDWWYEDGCILSKTPQREGDNSMRIGYSGYVVCETIQKSQAEAIIAVMRAHSPTAQRLAGELVEIIGKAYQHQIPNSEFELRITGKARELKEALGG